MEEVCVIKGCKRKIAVKKHGLCKAHTNRLYKTGTPGETKITVRKTHKPFKAQLEKKNNG